MYLFHGVAVQGGARTLSSSWREALPPTGIGFLLWALRISAEKAVGTVAATATLAKGFEHIGWPEGEIAFEELIAELARALSRPIEVRRQFCRLTSDDELLVIRASALMALGLAERVTGELRSLPGENTDHLLMAFTEVVTELRLVGLSFQMTHIPAVPRTFSHGVN